MTPTLQRWGVRLLAAFALIASAAVPARAVPKPEDAARAESPAEKARKALEQPIAIDFPGVTLTLPGGAPTT